ncbi:hypothetical protein CDD81_4906 [Ophiocordyceps australis]|uniref:RhoGAP-domain-containing protein n=1 Tax=Ophiocordyceps australis TaxID=1399860 RepID=A0A2C5XA89_9HYPO|nr:hypothetical protein CDD81_4906 [Ophiocordyceps australis]
MSQLVEPRRRHELSPSPSTPAAVALPRRGHGSPSPASSLPSSPPSSPSHLHHRGFDLARLISIPSLSSVGSLPHLPSPRSPLSPVSTSSPADSAAPESSKPLALISPLQRQLSPTRRLSTASSTHSGASREEESTSSDYSNSPDPSHSVARPDSVGESNDTQAADPVNTIGLPLQTRSLIKTPLPKAPGPAMASEAAAEPAPGVLRSSSIDNAILSLSASLPLDKSGSPTSQPKSLDIDGLVKAAGSPEVVIQHLLKDKHSQSQQNSQLWRLVDKQRAMILGLNKDLEAALKDKEKYRRKLKELMANPAVSRAATGDQHHDAQARGKHTAKTPSAEVEPPKVSRPNSPSIDSDSQKHSPVDITMAPYPITPPADRPQEPSSAVDELIDPKHTMPQPREHALDSFDHEAEEKAAEQEWERRGEEELKAIPYNVTLPPSRSLPSEPPKGPPPQPPTEALPSVAVSGPTPNPEEGLAMFPSPPRKPPPAPLRLKKRIQPALALSEEEDTDSDYDDDVLEVDKMINMEERGRRRTREADDRLREAASSGQGFKKQSSSQKHSSSPAQEPDLQTSEAVGDMPSSADEQSGSESRVANETNSSIASTLLSPKNRRDVMGSLASPGLPMSPRPLTSNSNRSAPASASLTPRMAGVNVPAPLSPRPPRHPIQLPSGSPLPSPTATTNTETSTQPLNPSKPTVAAPSQTQASAQGLENMAERSDVYKGLITDEYPDLLLPPNALPSIQVKVASSRMKPSRASLISLTQLDEDPVFTLAIMARADNKELWRVEKDIMSLAKLDQRVKQCTAFTARTPERSLFSGHAPAKLDARRIALEQYMEELLDTPLDTATAVELCRYLSTNTLPPDADETGSVSKGLSEQHISQKNGPDERPVRTGYLTKKGKNFGGWKARFFVVDGPQLKYYETPGGTHLGTIKLRHAQIGRQSPQHENQSPAQGMNSEDMDNQYRHAFLILEPKKKDSSSHVKHVLCAESDKERDLWVDTLLQWIDYRDGNEVEGPTPKTSGHERHGAGHDHGSGPRYRKGHQSRAMHYSTADSSDTLIGVRYDSTQAGQAPHGAPSKFKAQAAAGEHPSPSSLNGETMSSHQTSRMISGPRDPQVISDSASWGNRSGLSVPSLDEKKQRKRSFFGFGPKARSSSDGQDSLFGGSESGSVATPPHSTYHGPMRQVFGASLGEAVRYHPPADVNVPLPSVVYRCIEYLDSKHGILEEGIFRLSGSNVVIKQLRERFNNEGDVNLVTDEQYYDIHAVASLLKLYLRELPTTILTRDLHLEFLAVTEMTDREEKIAALHDLAQKLPQANATLLKYLISFLVKIINNSDVNKMNVRNVGIVFSPTLNIPAPVFAMFLQHFEGIFGVDPEQYELPSPVTDADVYSRSEGAMRHEAPPRLEPPARPSTSSGSASPHRHTRMEGRRDTQRSTPTPPLLMNMQMARGSVTPPPLGASRPHGEGSYHASFHAGSGHRMVTRPAYESGYGLPVNLMNFNPGQRPAPGYDRPIYGSANEEHGNGGQSHDVQASTNSRRRESSIFMAGPGGLQQYGSKSRLREEARY